MKIKIIFILVTIIVTTSCNYNKSVKKDFLTGIVSKGNGITCNEIYLTSNNKKINRNTFSYGEKFTINYEDVMGFIKVNGNDFPGMSIIVVNTDKDTVLFEPDLYKQYSDEGINYHPLLIQAMLTAAAPMHSGNKYTMFVHIWDKNGKNTYDSKFEFNIEANKNIKIEKTENVRFNEIYLFSNNTKNVITDNSIKINEPTYIIFEGLSGFKNINGKVSIGLSLIATDNSEKTILNYPDLYNNEEVSITEFNNQITPYVEFSSGTPNNPIKCIVTIWDKNSNEKIISKLNFNISTE